jgi:orotidine-5'-phosphate decarboxylase
MKLSIQPSVVIALDQLEEKKVFSFVDEYADLGVSWFKVGLEMFSKMGPSLVSNLKKRNLNVFLDLKLFDIPNTVAHAVKAAEDLGVDLLTVHLLGGQEMLEAAQKVRTQNFLSIVGVTLLTSFSKEDIFKTELFFSDSKKSTRLSVLDKMIQFAAEIELDGFVCSITDLNSSSIRGKYISKAKKNPLIITPGIRALRVTENIDTVAKQDQKEVGALESALQLGSTHAVMGRFLTGLSVEERKKKFFEIQSILKETKLNKEDSHAF